ncbi:MULTISPECIES: CPBP family intramembrane glutamic endopeptidase [Asticcacaulis]|uniref:CPBP family intramembrane glutamic endopeptidase n=1 Tax=Asticcacaulis TaxID=76890 RepID=UPI001AE96E55|nr:MULTISPECIES: type II CAAX endopeptidase family protein [Asticcacaulis]MBP2158821.1 membrane protease YdiL (CAAX protease family) [Asticcacaulis solisilvae]MDR6799867.1 membrane protease YdiL (CAAX protease family) [Asticcacaulis sp. BE141]
MQNWKTRHPLVLTLLFAALAYGWSYLCWRPILNDIKPNLFGMAPQSLALMLLGGFGPTAAAIILSLVSGGPREVGALLGRATRWRVNGFWYLLAFLFPLLAIGGGVAIYATLGHNPGPVRWDHWWIIAAFYGVAIFLGPLLEETGWRGFAQPVLFNRYGIFVTGMITGTLWTFWHTPLWFAAEGSSLSGGGLNAVSLGCYWLFLTGQSVAAAWMMSKARGSVIIAMILHQGMNAGAMGWLFYDIPAADKPWVFEQLPVIAIWALVGLGLMFGAMRGRVMAADQD